MRGLWNFSEMGRDSRRRFLRRPTRRYSWPTTVRFAAAAPGGGNLTERLSKLTDAKSLADKLYVSVLSRPPTDAEIAETSGYLASRPNERPVAIQELAWALIASLEFRFNH